MLIVPREWFVHVVEQLEADRLLVVTV